MIQATSEFLTAIKSEGRQCIGKAIFMYDTPLTVSRTQVQSIDVASSANSELGSVQQDNLTIKILKGTLNDMQFNAIVDVEVFLGCIVGTVEQYVSIGTFVSDGWNKDDTTGTITVKLTSKINENATVDKNVISHNVSIKEYAKEVVYSIFNKVLTAGGVLDTTLDSAYLYKEKASEQLKLIAMATNGLFRYVNGFELVPYKISTPVLTLKQGHNESVIGISRITDYSKKSIDVQILKSFFSKSDIISLFSANNIKLPPGASNYPVVMNLGFPCNVKYFNFNKYGYLQDFIPGVTKSTILLSNGYDNIERILSLEVFGVKIVSNILGKKEKTDGSITYIENPYIQNNEQITALDKRIYNAISYRVRYRGNPCLQIGDTVTLEGVGNILITKHQMTLGSGFSGIIEGVCIT